MKTLLAIPFALAATTPALAEWRLDNGVAIVSPASTNSTMELLAVSCGDPFFVEVYARGGPVRPDRGAGTDAIEVDYFYKPGAVQARVDGAVFALTAAGSDFAVVLFGEGSKDNGYMGEVPKAFVEALKSGTTLTLVFDVTPDAHADGTPHETTADFPLAGSGAVLDAALAGCT